MAYSTPSKYVKNMFSRNENQEDFFTKDQTIVKKQKIFGDITNNIEERNYEKEKQIQKNRLKFQELKQQIQQKNIKLQGNNLKNKENEINDMHQQKTAFKNQQKKIILELNSSFSQQQCQNQKEIKLNHLNDIQKQKDSEIGNYQEYQKNSCPSSQQKVVKKSNIEKLVLKFDSSQSLQEQKDEKDQKQSKKPYNKCILDLQYNQEESKEFQGFKASLQEEIEITRPLNIVQLIQIQEKYYLQNPIPKGYVFQTIIKRNLQNKNAVYQMFDQTTNISIIKVRIASSGYQFIQTITHDKLQIFSKSTSFENEKSYTSSISCDQQTIKEKQQDKNVIAILDSNFFGTQFNCFQISKQQRDNNYEQLQKKNRLATILYETNIFGLKGPRKMTVYIPNQDYLIKGKHNLQHAFLNQNKKHSIKQITQKKKAEINSKKQKQNSKILKFINRTPKWNNEIGAFVLNFNGRVTVSSVKNFIITDQNCNKFGSEKTNNFVLFGKISTNVFNLDIKYPFSLIQGLALALSSFDKKLACQ